MSFKQTILSSNRNKTKICFGFHQNSTLYRVGGTTNTAEVAELKDNRQFKIPLTYSCNRQTIKHFLRAYASYK